MRPFALKIILLDVRDLHLSISNLFKFKTSIYIQQGGQLAEGHVCCGAHIYIHHVQYKEIIIKDTLLTEWDSDMFNGGRQFSN